MPTSQTRPPRTIDEYVELVSQTTTLANLFALYQDEIEREGYQNVVFARPGGHADRFEVPYGCFPDGAAKGYFEEKMWEDDPIVAASRQSSMPFTWIDEMVRKTHSAAARRIFAQKEELGLRGGVTLPFHGPGESWHLISLSMRDRRMLDANRIHIVNIKSYATLQRFLALEDAAKTRVANLFLVPAREVRPQTPDTEPLCESRHDHPQHGEGAGVIANAECRAMVLVDISWRRYAAGLVKLNTRVPDAIGAETLQGFIDRGLIEEEADDERFCYVFKPSPIAQSHIRICPCVPDFRHGLLGDLVEAGEFPET